MHSKQNKEEERINSKASVPWRPPQPLLVGGASEKGEVTLNADYPRGMRLLCCGNPPPEAPDCLSISLQNVYFFLHESLIRYLEEAHSSRPQRSAGDVSISPICHIGWLRVWPLPLHCLPCPLSSPPPSSRGAQLPQMATVSRESQMSQAGAI